MDIPIYDSLFLSNTTDLSVIPNELLNILTQKIHVPNGEFLDALSKAALRPDLTESILTHYTSILPDLAARWTNWQGIGAIGCAYARVLPVVPFLSVHAVNALKVEDPSNGFGACLLDDKIPKADVLLAIWRLLETNKDAFMPLVNLVHIEKLLQHEDLMVRYLALRIKSIYIDASNNLQELATKELFGNQPIIGTFEGGEIDYAFLSLVESRRLQRIRQNTERIESTIKSAESPAPTRILNSSDLSPLTVDFYGVLLPRPQGMPAKGTSVVDTPTTRTNVANLAHAIRGGRPLLVSGEAGSGKTFLVEQAAVALNKMDTLVSIHLGEQTDAKLLIGTYTTGNTPGSFEWRPGVLTTAVKEGRWVLVEDIDKAPSEVLSLLLPLIEKNELHVPSRGERIKASSGFLLIATIKTQSYRGGNIGVSILGNRLWNQVPFSMPTAEELITMISSRYPLLTGNGKSYMAVYENVRNLYSSRAFQASNKSSVGRTVSPRDLFKWCARLNVLSSNAGIKDPNEIIPELVFDQVFQETCDFFAGSLFTQEARRTVVYTVAEHLNVAPQRAQDYFTGHVPAYKDQDYSFTVGRIKLKKYGAPIPKSHQKTGKRPFATTTHALKLLEQIGVAVKLAEPVLLVGETGTGKTTVVQHLADKLRKKLRVVNLSQQTESGDLLGGYKPIEMRTLMVPIKDIFDDLFTETFSAKKNMKFIESINKCFFKQKWQKVIEGWEGAVRLAGDVLSAPDPEPKENETEDDQRRKRRKVDRLDKPALIRRWTDFANSVADAKVQAAQISKSFIFKFVEGTLVEAARRGDWILLDEINLAAPDTLESIADLLQEGGGGSIMLTEKGEVERIRAHKDFRLFSCMNPATDVGKRDLPSGIRSRFTELYVTSPDDDKDNLLAVTREYLGRLAENDKEVCSDIADLYLKAKGLTESGQLVDGANQKAHFSMRTLTRTLSYAVEIAGIYGLRRSLYEGFCMSFLTLLDATSESLLFPFIEKHILGRHKNLKSLMSQIPRRPDDGNEYVQFKHFWMRKGAFEEREQAHYIITPFVEKNMLNLVRATSTRRFPVLIQGPTSSGKTSMVEFLAHRTGHKFVRINNHEHTDLQEYLGTYVSDDQGRMKFQEGILVEALRNGYWIVLDELNLAPTDVLEALNRLLDDNRELLIPETQEIVKPHPDFMLFATQNPPGLYGGRKMLSRAFRNRFLELHFDDIPEDELETILKERCQIAPSYCTRIVSVYKELSLIRQSTRLFEQKNSFATLRDLFRWANREAVGYQQLAENGYMLLAERVRKDEEKLAVQKVLEKVMRVKISVDDLYILDNVPEYQALCARGNQNTVVWTKATRRLFALVSRAIKNNEPILLVGETGSGKTSVCQTLSEALQRQLYIVNAHQNTETGDLIGAQRPVRNRTVHTDELVKDLREVLQQTGSGLNLEEASLPELMEAYNLVKKDESIPALIKQRIEGNRIRLKALFEWKDGSLIQAMKEGQLFLLDEISLADDSVLERLNSVLEPARTILLAEKGPDASLIKAADGFQFLATMNPGGDYGKKELSPALRNRFTEIWVPTISEYDDVLQIIESRIVEEAKQLSPAIVQFSQWYAENFNMSAVASVSIRQILAWVKFINENPQMELPFRFVHGAALVFIDGIGANPSAIMSASSAGSVMEEKLRCVSKLSELTGIDLLPFYQCSSKVELSDDTFAVGPFTLPRKSQNRTTVPFNLTAPTTTLNAMRILRAMQLHKPILLEGSPGVGKTSIVSALAELTGNPLVRINLSEQTDLMDLFGSDIPVEGGESGEFAWRDAPFLQAMQSGHWVLLDEMNLASQSVLEGLNACLDHRGEAYIAELDRTFKLHKDCVVFAAQNPHHQGGGRKGLPTSFVNRFTVVFVDSFTADDLFMISQSLYPRITEDDAKRMIEYICRIEYEIATKRSFGVMGSPWEFNLRDIMRWMGLLSINAGLFAERRPGDFLNVVVKQRFRSTHDRSRIDAIFEEVFGTKPPSEKLYYQLTTRTLQVGQALLQRNPISQPVSPTGLTILQSQLATLETVMTCVDRNWPCILVGAPGCGKSSVVKLLASLTGAELDEMALNNDVDTMDIVGGFEQIDHLRTAHGLLGELHDYLLRIIQKSMVPGKDVMQPNAEMLEILSLLTINISKFDLKDLDAFIFRLHKVEWTTMSSTVSFILSRLQDISSRIKESTMARFEWIDGTLVRAVEQGRWLLLDNANLCSASVLDRLNSLLEPNGVLIVNEHSGPDGKPKLVKPHPNFRLFLTMDPRHGELSRAMRNRGVEIFMDTGMANEDSEDDRRKTIAKYTPSIATEAAISRFDLFPTSPKAMTNFIYLLQAYFNHLTIGQLNLLQRFGGNINPGFWGSLTAEETQAVLEIADDYFHLCSHPQFRQLLHAQYKALCQTKGLDDSFISVQSINPLLNSALLSSESLDTRFESRDALAMAFENALDIISMGRVEEVVVHRSNTNSLERLTLAERDPRKILKKSGPDLTKYLISIRDALRAWLQQDFTTADQRTQRNIRRIVELWRDCADLAAQDNYDQSLLPSYVKFFEKWIASTTDADQTLVKTIKKVVQAFGGKLKLVTGFYLERLWLAKRPDLPPTVESWKAYADLVALTERFDKVAEEFNVNHTGVASTRQALIDAIALLLGTDQGIEKVPEELGQAIDELEKKNPDGSRSNVYKEEFEILLKWKELYHAGTGTTEDYALFKDVLPVFHGAGRQTKDFLSHSNLKVAFGFDQLLENAWKYGVSEEGVNGLHVLLEGRFGIELLKKSEQVKRTCIGSLPSTKAETEVLGNQFTKNMPILSVEPLANLAAFLTQEARQIFKEIAAGSYESSNLASISGVFEAFEKAFTEGRPLPKDFGDHFQSFTTFCQSQEFARVSERFFVPAFTALWECAQSISKDERVKLLGKAWALHSLGAISIFVPNNAFDPAQKQIVERERYLRRKSELGAKIEAFQAHEATFTGQTTSELIEWLKSEVERLGDEPEKSLVARPSVSGMNELQANFNALLEITVKGEKMETTLQTILGRGEGYQSIEKSYQETFSQMIAKLRERFPLYRDFLDPIFGYIYSLKLGLSLAATDVSQNRVEQGVILNPTELAGNAQVLTEEGRTKQEWLLYQLSALSTQRRIELPNARPETTSTMREIFDKLFWDWRDRMEKERAELAASTSLFKYKGVSDEDDEAEFRRMFPEEVLEDDDVMADNPIKKAEEDDKMNQPHKELAAKIARIQAAAFADVKPGTDPLRDLLAEASDILAKNTGNLSTAEPSETFVADILTLKHTDEYLQGKTKMDNYDFYQDENLEEAWRLVKILDSVKARFQVLHEAWPEHVTIQDVIEYSKDIAAMPNSTPIAKFLSRLERLHQTVHEWQTLASTEFTAIDQFNALTELIVSWRRLELQAWPKLLVLEESRCEFETQSFWFLLYESIVGNSWTVLTQNGEEELNTHVGQLTIALCAFLTSSSIGQFKYHLDMLLVFQKFIEEFYADSKGMLRIASVLKNVINYFSEYVEACSETLAATKKKIEKEVSEVVLLASWKDTNIVALRESAKRSHHKLFKVIRKYRTSLGDSVQMILMGNMKEIQPTQFGTRSAEAAFEAETLAIAQKICSGSISTWSSKPKRLIELQNTTKFMGRILKTADDALDVPFILENFVADTKDTIKTLQKETPGTLTEENKEAVKHLKSRKRKAYTDALKALRHMGLRSNLSAATMEQQKTTEKIFASLETIQSKYIETSTASRLFNRVLEYIQKVRRTPSEHSADLTGQEVARSVGYIEHLLSLEMEQRKHISSALTQFDALEDILKRVKKVSGLFAKDEKTTSAVLYGQPIANAHSFEAMKRRVKWLPRIIQFAVTVLKAHVSLRGNTYDNVGGLLLEYLQKSQIVREKLNGLSEITDSVWPEDLKDMMDEASKFLESLRTALETTIRKDIPELVYIADLILPWTQLELEISTVEASSIQNAEILDSSLQKLCDSIFVALQRLSTAFSALPTSQDDQGWLLAYHNASSQSLKSLAIHQVSKLMDDTLDKISLLGPFTPQSSRAIEALLTAHEPILSTYRNICLQTIERTLNLHENACRLSHTLSTTAVALATGGFCTPPEKSDEKGPGEPQGAEAGTGLADGEGMEDISKDIGADEDMEELAQEKKKDEDDDDKKDIEENEDAVDIEGDMDGDMKDVEEKEEEDKDGDKDGEEGEQEMDEETGEVDDLDPGAVDEKMWDGEEEEDARDKEGGPNDKQEQGTDDVTAKTEENKSKEPQKGDNEEAQDQDFPESDQEEDDDDEETKGNEGKEVQDQDGEQMDPHVPDVETLDLPDDMELDGQDKDVDDENEDDEFGDMGLDDPTDLDKEEDSKDSREDDDKKDDSKTEEFPEVDMKDKEDAEKPEGEAEEGEDDTAEKNGNGEADENPDEENGETEPQPEDSEPLVEKTEEDEKIYAEKEMPEIDENDSGAGGEQSGQTTQAQQPSSANQQEQQEQEKESKEGGADNSGENADEQMGTSEAADPAQNVQNQNLNQEQQEQPQDPFKKLGDALEKFRKQQQEIKDAKQEEETRESKPEDEMDLDNADFEHLPNEDAEADTQAMGDADEDQAQNQQFDDTNVIEQQDREMNAPHFPDDKEDVDMDDAAAQPEEHPEASDKQQTEGQQPGAMVGKPREDHFNGEGETEFSKMDVDGIEDIAPADELPMNQVHAQEQDLARPREEARQLWQKYEASTRELAVGLCEQLRLILEPTQATKMRGDYRTGKRLNMKRIIPYIASSFKKDKIWMRRSKPSKRQYQVLISVDDSRSMSESGAVDLTFQTVALIAKALSQLEVGQIGISSFGDTTELVHPFEKPFTAESGVEVFGRFGFKQDKTDVKALVEKSLGYFESQSLSSASSNSAEISQLQLIISDGVCEDHETLLRLVRRAREQKIMVVFVILDSGRQGQDERIPDQSILDMQTVDFKNGEMIIKRYLDSFPFEYYLVVKDVKELPGVLALALRQWLSEIVNSGG